MASTSETGHAKNVSNFQTLIAYCKGYDKEYQPSNPAITVAALETLLQNAKAALNEVSQSKTGHVNATNARQQVFKPIKPLVTRAINALASSGAQKEIVADARTLVRKLTGKRADTSTPKEGEESSNKNSVSQQSYDLQVEHFKSFRDILEAEPKYTPAEADLQIPTLTQKVTALEDVNNVLRDAEVLWSNKRNARKNILYHPETGLVATAALVKNYISSKYGATSPEFKQVDKLRFQFIKDQK
jgi:hypothetical protein